MALTPIGQAVAIVLAVVTGLVLTAATVIALWRGGSFGRDALALVLVNVGLLSYALGYLLGRSPLPELMKLLPHWGPAPPSAAPLSTEVGGVPSTEVGAGHAPRQEDER